MALTEEVKRDYDPQYPGLLKQRFIPFTAGAGTSELVAAVANKQLQIISFKFAVNVAGSYTLRSGVDDIFVFPMTASDGVFRDSGSLDLPIFCSNIGGHLRIITTAAVTAGGCYIQWREK